MRIGRTLPPAAAPIYFRDIISGIFGCLRGQREIERFGSEVKDFFSIKHCFLVSSGKAALTIILQALHDIHPERDEVLIPAFNCYSVPSAIKRAGLKIKLCDIDSGTLDFNYDELVTITSHQSANRLLAIVPTHLFGIPANIEKLKASIDDPSIVIIEDAAQAMGGELNGKQIGTLGDIGFFSLGRGKAFSTVEGGIILTDNDAIAERIVQQVSSLARYGFFEQIVLFIYSVILNMLMRPSLFWIPKSLPFLKLGETIYTPDFSINELSSFQAGLARNWQKKLIKMISCRSENSKHWTTFFSTNQFNSALKIQNSKLTSVIRFPIKIEDDKQIADILIQSDNSGLGLMSTYPDSINGIHELKDQFKNQDFPIAREYSKRLLTLPVHPFLLQKDIHKIEDLFN